MQITLPVDEQVVAQANAAGFDSVEAYVLRLIERDAALRTGKTRQTESAEEWIRGFRAFLQSLPPSNPNVDDSRESIYPVR